MTKRIIIAGCRDFENYNLAKEYIDFCISNLKKNYELIFMSGNCKGTDMLGEQYAKENGCKLELYPANWKKYGKYAGPKRNEQMAQICDYVICFWDGKSRGTKSMIDYSLKLNKPIKIKMI